MVFKANEALHQTKWALPPNMEGPTYFARSNDELHEYLSI